MYYVVYGLLWLVSLLPLRLLYVLSDGFYLLIFYVFRYRRPVVMSNLKIAFPQKTEQERKQIAKKFYRNFVDTFIETIKMITASDKFILRRFTGDWEVINSFYKTGKSVQLHLGHNFNWEWANIALSLNTPFKFLAVYMPLTSKIFEKLFYKLRSRTGTVLLPATNMKNSFLPHRGTQYLLGLVADQNPGYPGSNNAWWFYFFDRPAPFLKGPEKGAINNRTAVVFAHITRPKRGYYHVHVSVAAEDASLLPESELTRKYVSYLAATIEQNPDMWLWSHRRWKWEWKEEYGAILS